MINTTGYDAAGRGDDAAAAARAAAAGTSGRAADGTDTSAGIEDRFLKLLVAQMRHQDPLNPLDNTEVTSQLAQINTVRGIEELNQSMRTMVGAATAESPLSAVGLLGRQVLVPGESFEWSGSTAATPDPLLPAVDDHAGTGARLGFEWPDAAQAVRADVVDVAGRVLYSREFSAPASGAQTVQTFDWDGIDGAGRAVPAGQLGLRVFAIDGAGVDVPITGLVPARVQGISQSPTGARIDLSGGGAVSIPDIRAVL